jgi:REP element-mobilizing transposase RayT
MSEAYKTKDPNAIYFLTFQVVFWLDIFTRQEYRDIIIDSLKFCREQKHLKVYTFVIMSNHVHLVARSGNGTMSDTIRDFKKYTANEILERINSPFESRKKWLLNEMAFAARKHKRNSKFQLWTHDNHAIELSSNQMIDQRVDYVHNNPVKAGIVEKPEDYLYSSARSFCEGFSTVMEIDVF